ncbi:MAG TPA: alpha/beta fold hydrolase [Gammaproteobacteria bacterium]|nr:alpha/beta fold hydrolase [Gammaproteobacteria bacterium]
MGEPEFLIWHGHHVCVSDTGRGEPLLLVNGLGCDVDTWTPFVRQFAGRRIIRFDAPGAGRSSVPLFPVSVAALGELAAVVLDHYAIASADVVGFSYGGAVAQQLAFDRPERVRRLVLAATTCGLGSVPGSLQAMAVLATTLRFYSPGYFERMAPALYGGVTGRAAAAHVTRQAAAPPSTYGYAMQLLGATGWTSLPFLDRIPHETLVISGDDDPLVPVENAEFLAQRIPRARLEIVERAGHLFLLDDAENLAPRIGRFVDAEPLAI